MQERIKQVAKGPYWQHLDMQVVSSENGEATVKMEIKHEHMQAYGVVHGGALASLIDSAIGIALNSTLAENQGSTTTNLQIMYARPAVSGTLTAKAKLIKRGKSIVFGECSVTDEQDALIVSGSATYMILDLRRWSKDKNLSID